MILSLSSFSLIASSSPPPSIPRFNMPSSESALKRSSSSLSNGLDGSISKRPKRAYHRYHRLQHPIKPVLPEPAVTDDVSADHLMDRAIATSLKEAGFEMAEPVALESVRQAAEECMYSELQALEFVSSVNPSRCSEARFIRPTIDALLATDPANPSRFRICIETTTSPCR